MDRETEESAYRLATVLRDCEVIVEPGCEYARIQARSVRVLYKIEGPWGLTGDPLEYLAYGPGQHPVLVISYGDEYDAPRPAMVDRLSEIKM